MIFRYIIVYHDYTLLHVLLGHNDVHTFCCFINYMVHNWEWAYIDYRGRQQLAGQNIWRIFYCKIGPSWSQIKLKFEVLINLLTTPFTQFNFKTKMVWHQFCMDTFIIKIHEIYVHIKNDLFKKISLFSRERRNFLFFS